MSIELIYGDCMDFMATLPDKAFDLAIVDVPYGIKESSKKRENSKTEKWANPYQKKHNIKNWDDAPPEQNYFKELRRVSKNQIIWGANHFISRIPIDSSCWIVWDKRNGESDFADCELALTTFGSAVRKFDWLWNGFQKQQPEIRIHPTQKPVALYSWLLHNYAKQGQRILDTHLGSGSSAIAAHYFGCDFVGIEKDEDYFNAAKQRFEQATAQATIFDIA